MIPSFILIPVFILSQHHSHLFYSHSTFYRMNSEIIINSLVTLSHNNFGFPHFDRRAYVVYFKIFIFKTIFPENETFLKIHVMEMWKMWNYKINFNHYSLCYMYSVNANRINFKHWFNYFCWNINVYVLYYVCIVI